MSHAIAAIGAGTSFASQLTSAGTIRRMFRARRRCRRRHRRLFPAAPAASRVPSGELDGVQAKVQAGDEAKDDGVGCHRPRANVAHIQDAPAQSFE